MWKRWRRCRRRWSCGAIGRGLRQGRWRWREWRRRWRGRAIPEEVEPVELELEVEPGGIFRESGAGGGGDPKG